MESVVELASRKGRAEFVASYAGLFGEAFVNIYFGPDGIALIEEYASRAPEVASTLSREVTEHLLDDEAALTAHAWWSRSLRTAINNLRDIYLPNIRRNIRDDRARCEAIATIAYIDGHFKAMGMLIL